MDSSLHEYESMWTTRAKDYVLLCADPASPLTAEHASIIDRTGPTLHMIELDDVFEEVKRRMVEAGVPLVRLCDIIDLFPPPECR